MSTNCLGLIRRLLVRFGCKALMDSMSADSEWVRDIRHSAAANPSGVLRINVLTESVPYGGRRTFTRRKV